MNPPLPTPPLARVARALAWGFWCASLGCTGEHGPGEPQGMAVQHTPSASTQTLSATSASGASATGVGGSSTSGEFRLRWVDEFDAVDTSRWQGHR